MNSSDFNRFDEPTRRRFITNAAKMYLGVQLMPFFNGAAAAAPAAAKEAVKAKAKAVIYLYMSGGMSHLDTFDPKPKKKEEAKKAATKK